jgi:outer membrane protein TolC
VPEELQWWSNSFNDPDLNRLVERALGENLTVRSAGVDISTAPVNVALGMPQDLLRRRPDVRGDERRLAAQSARIGFAVSDLYPHFTIGGSIGTCSTMAVSRAIFARRTPRSVSVAAIQYQEGSITFNTLISTLAANTQQQDLLSATQGSVATSLVQVYKALGGGWEIRNGQDPVDLLPDAMKAEMRERTGAWEGVLN